MPCCATSGHGDCLCVSPGLWSNAKKIRVLQDKLHSLDEKKSEIETLIRELESGK